MNSNHFSLSDEAIESTYQARSIETDVGGGAGSSKKSWQANKNLKKANLQSHKNPYPGGRESVFHIFLFLVQFFTWSQKSRRELLDNLLFLM